jgi:hypothetical protein
METCTVDLVAFLNADSVPSAGWLRAMVAPSSISAGGLGFKRRGQRLRIFGRSR